MKMVLIAVLVAFALLFAGCASSPQQPAQNQPAQVQQQNQPAANNPPPAQQQPGESAADTFANILGLRATMQYKASYDISSNAGGQASVSQMTQYMKGADKMRIDSAYGGMESRSYMMDDLFYSCSSQQGTWTCMKIALAKDDSTKAMDDIQLHKDDYQIVSDGTMPIAGVTASCYKVTGKNIESYRACHSPEGVPLYMKMTSTSEGASFDTEMVATSYSTSVSDADFTLPATPTEIPSIPGGSGVSGSQDMCSYCSYMTGSDKEDCLASYCGSS